MYYLQEGAIQMNQPDGSLRLFPLFDASMFTAKPLDSVRTRQNWIGAIYYRIIEKTWQGKKYYTLCWGSTTIAKPATRNGWRC
jgi:hypothetical protein